MKDEKAVPPEVYHENFKEIKKDAQEKFKG